MSGRAAPKLPKWPFFLADVVLLGTAWLIFWQSKTPMTVWDSFFCSGCVALGAVLCVTPFLLEYRGAIQLSEADRLANAVLQIENMEIIGRQINHATASWQTAHEQATKTVEAAREIAASMTTEARAFSEFLKKANDTEKNHLRLEVDKLRRAENEWLQILVRILDHIYALYQAAVRSGQGNLVKQLEYFQNACRDISRRVGLVPFIAIPGEPYDAKLHQLADASAPATEGLVAETLATGYSFQGQLVRPALVTLRNRAEPAHSEPSAVSTDPRREPARAAEEPPPMASAEAEFPAAYPMATPEISPQPAEPAQEFASEETPDAEPEQSRL